MTHRGLSIAVSLLLAPGFSLAAEGEGGGELNQLEVESWLEADPDDVDVVSPSAEPEAPLPAPRERGWVVEGSLGALGHLGHMRHISPVAPWFRLQVGYEPLDWLMVFGQGDVSVTSTEYAKGPPEERGYALFGFGLGSRLSVQPWDALGFHLQGDVGLSSVNHDVLATYGYPNADRLRPYFGGTLGIDWFQVSPHYALSVYGGVRDYIKNFERINGVKPPVVWVGGLAVRYTL